MAFHETPNILPGPPESVVCPPFHHSLQDLIIVKLNKQNTAHERNGGRSSDVVPVWAGVHGCGDCCSCNRIGLRGVQSYQGEARHHKGFERVAEAVQRRGTFIIALS